MSINLVVLGGINNDKGVLSDFTKKRITKCYKMLDDLKDRNIYIHFSGSFRFNNTNIIHSQICCNYFNQINEKKYDVNINLHTNKSTIEEAIHFGEYFKNSDKKLKIITSDWHMNRVEYIFEKTFEFYNIKNYELIHVESEIINEMLIHNETNKLKELIEKPYGLWKEWLVNNYYDKFLHLKLINKNDNDGKTIVNMRNENTKFFFNNEKFEWESFKPIFYTKYFSNEIPPFFIFLKNQIVGFVGCKTVEKDVNDIGIMFFKEFQNRGLGKISLKKFLKIYDEDYYKENKVIISQILKSNIGSYKIFIANHFKLNDSKTTDGTYYLTY